MENPEAMRITYHDRVSALSEADAYQIAFAIGMALRSGEAEMDSLKRERAIKAHDIWASVGAMPKDIKAAAEIAQK
jgi:hypothetical protein